MTLTLTIVNAQSLPNGSPTAMTLDRRGATIGRSPHVDWSLPDPQSHISSSHCDIEFRDGDYWLVDKSTNGTYLNGAQTRLPGPHRLGPGDRIAVGHYVIEAQLGEAGSATGFAAPAPPAPQPEWGGWDSHGSALPPPDNLANWGAPPARSAISGEGAMSANWTPPPVSPPVSPPSSASSSPWDAPPPPPSPASGWSSPGQAGTSGSDVWSQLAETNVVDWARGGFGSKAAQDLSGWGASPSTAPAGGDIDWGSGPGGPPPAPAPAPGQASGDWGGGLAPPAAPGIASPQAAPVSPPSPPQAATPTMAAGQQQAATARATALLGRMVAGLVVMLEARARAKAQLGAQGTSLSLNGNNPLKFARSAEAALEQLLAEPERGFMPAEEAIEDAFHDLQAHQMATLAAMQGALASTLDRFAPSAIRKRAESKGLLARIMPNAQDAAMWKAYEREFEGVVKGSDEAFMEVFAKEFRDAYEKAASGLKRKG